jgi:hypothetical protein
MKDEGSVATDTDHERLSETTSNPTTMETKMIKGARTTVLLVLLVSAITVATLAYVLISQSEASSFRAQVRILQIYFPSTLLRRVTSSY